MLRLKLDIFGSFRFYVHMSGKTCTRDEIRDAQVKAAVYPSEKERVERLARKKKKTVSDLLRDELLKMLKEARL